MEHWQGQKSRQDEREHGRHQQHNVSENYGSGLRSNADRGNYSNADRNIPSTSRGNYQSNRSFSLPTGEPYYHREYERHRVRNRHKSDQNEDEKDRFYSSRGRDTDIPFTSYETPYERERYASQPQHETYSYDRGGVNNRGRSERDQQYSDYSSRSQLSYNRSAHSSRDHYDRQYDAIQDSDHYENSRYRYESDRNSRSQADGSDQRTPKMDRRSREQNWQSKNYSNYYRSQTESSTRFGKNNTRPQINQEIDVYQTHPYQNEEENKPSDNSIRRIERTHSKDRRQESVRNDQTYKKQNVISENTKEKPSIVMEKMVEEHGNESPSCTNDIKDKKDESELLSVKDILRQYNKDQNVLTTVDNESDQHTGLHISNIEKEKSQLHEKHRKNKHKHRHHKHNKSSKEKHTSNYKERREQQANNSSEHHPADKQKPASSDQHIKDKQRPITSEQHIKDKQRPGTSEQHIIDKQRPGTIDQHIKDIQRSNTSEQHMKDRQSSGSSEQHTIDKQRPGTSEQHIIDKQRPGTIDQHIKVIHRHDTSQQHMHDRQSSGSTEQHTKYKQRPDNSEQYKNDKQRDGSSEQHKENKQRSSFSEPFIKDKQRSGSCEPHRKEIPRTHSSNLLIPKHKESNETVHLKSRSNSIDSIKSIQSNADEDNKGKSKHPQAHKSDKPNETSKSSEKHHSKERESLKKTLERVTENVNEMKKAKGNDSLSKDKCENTTKVVDASRNHKQSANRNTNNEELKKKEKVRHRSSEKHRSDNTVDHKSRNHSGDKHKSRPKEVTVSKLNETVPDLKRRETDDKRHKDQHDHKKHSNEHPKHATGSKDKFKKTVKSISLADFNFLDQETLPAKIKQKRKSKETDNTMPKHEQDKTENKEGNTEVDKYDCFNERKTNEMKEKKVTKYNSKKKKSKHSLKNLDTVLIEMEESGGEGDVEDNDIPVIIQSMSEDEDSDASRDLFQERKSSENNVSENMPGQLKETNLVVTSKDVDIEKTNQLETAEIDTRKNNAADITEISNKSEDATKDTEKIKQENSVTIKVEDDKSQIKNLETDVKIKSENDKEKAENESEKQKETEEAKVKDEPSWLKFGYTQEPDTIFLSDNDDDMIMSFSQPIINLDTSSDDNAETDEGETDKKDDSPDITVKPAIKTENKPTAKVSDILESDNFSSPDEGSDRGSDFEPEQIPRSGNINLSQLDSDYDKSDDQYNLYEDIFLTQVTPAAVELSDERKARIDKPKASTSANYDTFSKEEDVMVIDDPKDIYEAQTQNTSFLKKPGKERTMSDKPNDKTNVILEDVYQAQTQVDQLNDIDNQFSEISQDSEGDLDDGLFVDPLYKAYFSQNKSKLQSDQANKRRKRNTSGENDYLAETQIDQSDVQIEVSYNDKTDHMEEKEQDNDGNDAYFAATQYDIEFPDVVESDKTSKKLELSKAKKITKTKEKDDNDFETVQQQSGILKRQHIEKNERKRVNFVVSRSGSKELLNNIKKPRLDVPARKAMFTEPQKQKTTAEKRASVLSIDRSPNMKTQPIGTKSSTADSTEAKSPTVHVHSVGLPKLVMQAKWDEELVISDATKTDMWLSKSTAKSSDAGKGKSGKRKRRQSKEDTGGAFKARMQEAKSKLAERNKLSVINPDAIADPAAKRLKPSVNADDQDDVDLPTCSQIISKGLPLLNPTDVLVKGKTHTTQPGSRFQSNLTETIVGNQVRTASVTTTTSTESMATPTSTSLAKYQGQTMTSTSPVQVSSANAPKPRAKTFKQTGNKSHQNKPSSSVSKQTSGQFSKFASRPPGNFRPSNNPLQNIPLTSTLPADKPPVVNRKRDLKLDMMLRVMLKWSPNWFEEKEELERIGRHAELPLVTNDLCGLNNHIIYPLCERYDSFDEYCDKFMLPLLLHETFESCYSSWREKKARGELEKQKLLFLGQKPPADKLIEYNLLGLISERDRVSWKCVLEGDLVQLKVYGELRQGDNADQIRYAVMGFVEKVTFGDTNVKRICKHNAELGKMKKHDSISVKIQLKIRWRSFFPNEKQLVEIQPVSTITSTIRQFHGLAYLPKSFLCRDLLYPTNNPTYCDQAAAIISGLRDNFNESQSVAINTAANIVSQHKTLPRICLLQGPTGTGKSHTIVGIIDKIVRDSQGKCCICLCAPSHAAVDELLRRLIRINRNRDKSNQIRLVRLGEKSSIHADIQSISMDSLIEKNVLQSHKAEMLRQLPTSLQGERRTLETKIAAARKFIENATDNLQVQKKKLDLKKLEKQKQNLDSKCEVNLRNLQIKPEQQMKIRNELLGSANVIAGTLSSIGSQQFKSCFQSNINDKPSGFDCVIIDEAQQAIELDTLIPLQYGVSKLILVGDPEQLHPTVLSKVAQDNKLNMSLFERLDSHFRNSDINPVIRLDTQYRMDKEIASFPNNNFYEGRIKNHKTVLDRSKCPLVPYLLYDIREGQEQFSKSSRSMSNPSEARFTAELCKLIVTETQVTEKVIGIIAPYAEQKSLIIQKLRHRNLENIDVSTVDGFQGREKHVIIMSCVRANVSGSVGFVGNRNRMNVSLTRAKYAMYLVGHFASLECSKEWKPLVTDAKQRRKFITVDDRATEKAIKMCLKNIQNVRPDK